MGKTRGGGSGSDGGGESASSKYRRWPEKNTDEYVEKREKNNAAVKKSREKARRKAAETAVKVAALRGENSQLEDRVDALERELADLKEVFFAKAAKVTLQGTATASAATVATSADVKVDLKP